MTAELTRYRLRLFGAPSLEHGDGGVVTGRVAHRHRLALLALLALAPGRRVSRDKLIALLWPDSDPDRGRNSLNVATYTIRKALGDDAIVTAVDDLCLDPDAVGSDVAEFTQALAAADPARAVALYAGPFLDGFFLSDAPELEQWIARERHRLADERARALESLAEEAERAGEHVRAVEWWKARAAADPLDSRVALRLVQALDASGNRSGALQHAAVHQRLLDQELGATAVPATFLDVVERVRRAPVPVPNGPSVEVVTDAPVAASPRIDPAVVESHGSPPRRRARWIVAAVATVAVVAIVVAIAAIVWQRQGQTALPAPSIVVLPFVNLSPDPADAYFADGLTEEVISRLAAVPGLTVISRTSAMHYQGTRRPLGEIARELHVAQVLEGSVRRADGRVRVTAQLIDAASDVHRWAQSFEYDQQHSLRVQEDVARAVARVLEVELGPQARRQLVRRGTDDPEAQDLYQRGRVFWQTRSADGHAQAIRFFERAIALDSSYADAWAGLADAYLTGWQNNVLRMSETEALTRMRAAAERAIAIDDESAAAHTSFGLVLWSEKDWPAAARELRCSLELNPGQAMTRSWYTLLLRATGHAADATRENQRAAELDPFAVAIAHNGAWHCYHDRDFACVIDRERRSISFGAYPPSYGQLAVALSQVGRHAEALDAMRTVIALAPQRPELVADLAYVQAMAGRRAEARATLRRAAGSAGVEGFNVGRAYVALHEPDSVFAWLDRASWRWPHRAMLTDPALDPVRSDPRFARLRARVAREMGVGE